MDNFQLKFQGNRAITVILSLFGAIQPTPVPFAGIHKFYLGQYGWGIVYVLLGATQVPRIACAVEAVWYLVAPQLQKKWAKNEGEQTPGSAIYETVESVANGLREIEHLRQEGLLSEQEFEQKRRRLLEQMP